MIHLTSKREGFSMLTAIVVIVTMAVLAAYVMSTSGKALKITTDQYRKEQAMILAKSYTEYAIMAVSANAGRVNAGGCLTDIDALVTTPGQANFGINRGRGEGYNIRVRIAYIGTNNAAVIDINNIENCAALRTLSDALQPTTRSPINIIIDTYVEYNDLNDNRADDAAANGAGNGELRHFTYHRRSLQKI